MGHLSNRLKFAEQQYEKILTEAKKSKRKSVVLKYITGIQLTVCLGGFFHKDSHGNFSSSGIHKDIISIFPFGPFFLVLLSVLSLLTVPLIFIFPITIVLIYYTITTIFLCLFGFWFSNNKRSKFDNFLSRMIPKLYPFSLHRTLTWYSRTTIHELVHFYDKRLDLMSYQNFKVNNLGSKDKTYFNEVTEINAHLVEKLYIIKNKKFDSFVLFYKEVSKHTMFNYLTDDNRKLVYKYLDEYYHETKKEN